eukprot:2834049-Prymnesium_polylepis.1
MGHIAAPPMGRSFGAVLVTSESGSVVCAYNVTISRGLNADASMHSLTLYMAGSVGGGTATSTQSIGLPAPWEAVNGVIVFSPAPLDHWVVSVDLGAVADASAEVFISCPDTVTCTSRRRELLSARAEADAGDGVAGGGLQRRSRRARRLVMITSLP